jgi:hypothetical protein
MQRLIEGVDHPAAESVEIESRGSDVARAARTFAGLVRHGAPSCSSGLRLMAWQERTVELTHCTP